MCLCVCACIIVCVCMYVSACVCLCEFVRKCLCAFVFVHMRLYVLVRVYDFICSVCVFACQMRTVHPNEGSVGGVDVDSQVADCHLLW